jgi:carboxyl-terminal processing protease
VFNLSLGALVITHYHEIGRLLKVTALIKSNALHPATTEGMFEGALRGIVGSLNDPYSNYLDINEYKDLVIHIQGSFGGLGILVGIRDDRLTVGSPPFKETPAEKAGIRSRDVIVQIDERKTDGMDLETAIALMRGQPGTQVHLILERVGEQNPIEVTLTRDIINIPSVESKILESDNRIGYLHLYSFSGNTSRDFNASLEDLLRQGIKALVLDLRYNGGGDFGVSLEIANHFVPKGPVVRVLGRDNKEDIYEADGGNLGIPLVVLVNDMSASASEIVAGAIKDTGAGILLGTKTYGKGLVQAVYPLAGGAGVKLTTHKYLTPNGHDINQKGIEPDILVDMPQDSQQDLQLEKAVEVIRDKI